MSNEPETKLPERAYVLSALLGLMCDKAGSDAMRIEAFIEKYKVTPEERRRIARAALHEKITDPADSPLAIRRESVDRFLRDEGLTEDDVRDAALAILRGAFKDPDEADHNHVSHAVEFLYGEGRLIEPTGPSWSFTGACEYAQDLAEAAGLNPSIATDLSFCEYDEGNHSDCMVNAPPELWQLMQDTGAWKPAPATPAPTATTQSGPTLALRLSMKMESPEESSTFGDVLEFLQGQRIKEKLFGVCEDEGYDMYLRLVQELCEAMKAETGSSTLEEFNSIDLKTTLDPKSETCFTTLKAFIARGYK